jgi:hypothetical protein
MPRLEKWQLINNHLYGEIFSDEKNRFEGGTSVKTSSVEEIDEVTGFAQTRNTRYELGEKLKVD